MEPLTTLAKISFSFKEAIENTGAKFIEQFNQPINEGRSGINECCFQGFFTSKIIAACSQL